MIIDFIIALCIAFFLLQHTYPLWCYHVGYFSTGCGTIHSLPRSPVALPLLRHFWQLLFSVRQPTLADSR